MERTGLMITGSTEGLGRERTATTPRWSILSEASVAAADGRSACGTAAGDYVIELGVAAGFLWWWSLYEVIGLAGEEAEGRVARSVAPAAEASFPHLSQGAALRAGKRAARALSDGVSAEDRAGPRLSRRSVVLTLILLAAAAVAATFLVFDSSGTANPRTEVLRSTSPLSGIWVRITGPGGAVDYVGSRFLTGGAFRRFTLRKAPQGSFMPPPIRNQKLCGATHVIQPGDASQLQKWQGKKLAISIYGEKASAIYCAVLGYGLYLG